MTNSRYDTPEKQTSKRDNPALLPPPAKNNGTGNAYRKGLGMGYGGSYPRYRTAKALEDAVELYFETKKNEKEGGAHLTMAGLALSLGFKSVASLKRYEASGEEYADVIEVARTRVEEYKNVLLLDGGRQTNGVIFDLKNHHGYSDKIEQKTTVEAGGTLADLLAALQGTVLRPILDHQPDNNDIEDGEFYDVNEIINDNPQDFDNYLDNLEDTVDFEDLI